jgi:hypothetical protein
MAANHRTYGSRHFTEATSDNFGYTPIFNMEQRRPWHQTGTEGSKQGGNSYLAPRRAQRAATCGPSGRRHRRKA